MLSIPCKPWILCPSPPKVAVNAFSFLEVGESDGVPAISVAALLEARAM